MSSILKYLLASFGSKTELSIKSSILPLHAVDDDIDLQYNKHPNLECQFQIAWRNRRHSHANYPNIISNAFPSSMLVELKHHFWYICTLTPSIHHNKSELGKL